MSSQNGFCSKTSDVTLSSPLETVDPELYSLVNQEAQRQKKGLELIASENFTSVSVLQCLGSCLTNKYSEGLPGARYYGGNQIIDQIELLCQKRCLEAFSLDSSLWGVNVQPYSGSPANVEAYTALVGPRGRIMGLNLPDGGHISHGLMTQKKRLSAASIFFETMPYHVDLETGLIDYKELEKSAQMFKPDVIIAGVTSYPRTLDYKRFKEISIANDSYLMADMSHISGLVAAGVIPSPFEYCDVVTSTTHKTLRGPRGGIIFYRKGIRSVTKSGENIMYDLEDRVNAAVFPGFQGGPHNNAIAGIAAAMKLATTQEFKDYQKQVLINCKQLAESLKQFGYKITTDGTDVHMLLVDLRPINLTGSKAEYILQSIEIACNKNTVPGDKSAMNPYGIRLGTPALTTRGMKENDIMVVAELIHKGLCIALEAQKISGPKLANFKNILSSDPKFIESLKILTKEVETFAEQFYMPQ
ncbi:serine hydroxymethyltransferase isoform X2 [Daktulosphaira vitifoliae]|nr:serine hydroxymethyltransferase isoform X2 [Daktulosphaira vitifoliae]XP_050542566.1 serine hydroxymethyltransferase isoform X2 [Daktulosphaira vitifoliae]